MLTAMVATLPAETDRTTVEGGQSIAELLRPDVLAEGHEPEARVSHYSLSWQRYLELDKAFGDDRPGPRFYYLDGELEIMSTSEEHERITECIGGLMDLYFDEQEFDLIARGHATMRLELKKAGAEPDKSWCIGGPKQFPDLVLETALSSGGVSKLELYRRFEVPEVWIWRKGKLEVYSLLTDASGYERAEAGSRLLPNLDIALLEQCAKLPNWREARKAFRAGLASKQ